MARLNADYLASKCNGLKPKFYLPHFLSYKLQVKTGMSKVNPFTHVQNFQTSSLYTSSLVSLYSCTIILFSYI